MITAAQLASVGAAAQANPSLAALRLAFPELHFSECSEDDVSPCYQPAAHLDAIALYLISGASGHCLALTNDAAAATGILLAAKVDED